MTNFQVYKKTISFSLVGFLVDLLALAILVGLSTAGYFLFEKINGMALLGLAIGFVVAVIACVLISIFISNRIKAAQIAMMTKGVNGEELPEHTYKEGLNHIKGRFGKITLFFLITNSIKGIFRQIGQTMTGIGKAVGGQVGEGVAGAIDSAVQTLIGYLCDCCLGWIFYREEINAFKAGCEGCVIFFKHGKTLIRNVGRIFGMGFLSFLLIGGAFFGVSYLVFTQFPNMFISLSNEIMQLDMDEAAREFLSNPQYLMLFVAGIGAIVIWSMFHSVLIRPFILVGVLRNFLEAGKQDIPNEADIADLEKRAPRMAKLSSRM